MGFRALAVHIPSMGVAQPGVSAQVRRLEAELGDGQLDLALIGVAGETPPEIKTTVAIGQLRDLPLVSLPRGTGVRAALDAACAAAGFTPRIVFEASALLMVVELAARGLGLAVVPASIPNEPRILRFTDPPMRSRLELAWPPAPSANPAARALIEQARALGPRERPVSRAAHPRDRGPD